MHAAAVYLCPLSLCNLVGNPPLCLPKRPSLGPRPWEPLRLYPNRSCAVCPDRTQPCCTSLAHTQHARHEEQ